MAHASGNEQWQDYPSTQTPVTATTLENIETFLDDADGRINDAGSAASDAQAAAQAAADSASAAQGAAENSATSADNANQVVQTFQDNSTANPDPTTYVIRDANGNARFADPLDPNDAATRGWVLANAGSGGGAWIGNKPYTAGDIVIDPYGYRVVRISNGTARANYDATEAALWNEVTGITSVSRFGVKADGTTDDTSAMTAAIGASINRTLVLPGGTILTGPLDFNGATRPSDAQWNGVGGIRGYGRLVTTFKAKSGLYSAGQAVVTLKNVSGVSVGGFSVEAQNIADVGCNFSWVGGSSGNPAIAPSNRNNFYDIFVRGAVTIGINFDQQHDSAIHAIAANSQTSTGICISLLGGGGGLAMSDVVCSVGKFRVASQQATFFDCNFFDGISLEGAGYNHCTFVGGQVYPNNTSLVSIDGSGASGNSNSAIKFDGTWFSSGPGGHTLVQGRYQTGITFLDCRFQSGYTAFFGTVTPANGTGALPRMAFGGCTFGSTTPASVTNQLTVSSIGVNKTSAGAVVNFGITDVGDATAGTGLRVGGGTAIIRQILTSPLTPSAWATDQIIPNGTSISTTTAMGGVANGNGFMVDCATSLPAGVSVVVRGAGTSTVRLEVINNSGSSYTLTGGTTFRVYAFLL